MAHIKQAETSEIVHRIDHNSNSHGSRLAHPSGVQNPHQICHKRKAQCAWCVEHVMEWSWAYNKCIGVQYCTDSGRFHFSRNRPQQSIGRTAAILRETSQSVASFDWLAQSLLLIESPFPFVGQVSARELANSFPPTFFPVCLRPTVISLERILRGNLLSRLIFYSISIILPRFHTVLYFNSKSQYSK